MEVVSSDENKVLWRVVENRFVEEETDNDEIGLRGLYLICSTNTRRG